MKSRCVPWVPAPEISNRSIVGWSFSLLTAILAGFGQASAEVGAVMIVEGNIEHATRVMTTDCFEVSKGDLSLAGGLILLTLSACVNGTAFLIGNAAQRTGTPN